MEGNEDGNGSSLLPPALERSLPDNAAEYMLFVLDHEGGDNKAARPLARLEQLRKAAMQLSDKLTRDYIWQRDAFNLEVVSRHGLLYLHGVTDYGDCVEDEWLIVYMLRELSKSFAGSVWARICDSDGEFLLVEAAQAVPSWLNPEMDAHRVWIHDGQLRVIRPAGANDASDGSVSASGSPSLSLGDAVRTIRTAPGTLLHLPALEREAFYRLEKYPGHIAASVHYARAILPRKVAYVLHDRPRTIAPAADALCQRDPLLVQQTFGDARPSTAPAYKFPPVDLVTVSVKFSRVLFAQLRGQRFTPPAAWSRAYAAYVEAEAAKGEGKGKGKEKEKGEAAVDEAKWQVMANLGVKVACGFELLAATAETSNNRLVREVALVLDDLDEDGGDGNGDDNTAAVLPTDEEIWRWPDVDRDDDEAWLNIDFADFERELDRGRQKASDENGPSSSSVAGAPPGGVDDAEFGAGFGDAGVQTDLRKIVSRFQAFLDDHDAGIEGADLDDMDEDDDEEEDEDEDDGDGGVNFDEEEFSRLMREMMGLPPAGWTKAAATAPATKSGDAASALVARSAAEAGDGDMEGEDDDDDDEEKDILNLAAQFEAELRGHGALRLDPPAKGKQPADTVKRVTADETSSKDAGRDMNENENEDESGDESEVDVDLNLAKNLLESFKSQGGLPGPASNILGMMGLSLPRDDDEVADTEDSGKGNGRGSRAKPRKK
ncbi:sgt1 [Niveomyces insectorum RCEF 264]|uniref:Sgt1 n=1 Tax=Niveomyces insectorum RCEF 264 TaxID=1081102 RepID=A0A167MLD8_9HYPO|nr:sgt1 [Niveomyces insectorum RCEF 264]